MADTPDFNTLMRQAAQCIDIVYQTCVLAISANRLEQADAIITTMNMAVNNMEAMLRDRLKLNISPTNNNQCYYDPEELEPAHKAADPTISSEEFAEYVKRCASCYRRAADAVCEGSYTPELAAELKKELAVVFNRGFWDGYYQGAYLGQWSEVYGSQATHRKVYCGKVTNWFDRVGVVEITVESTPISRGDKLMAIGATTGVVEFEVGELRVNLQPVETAAKGVRCSVMVDPSIWPGGRLRRGDKVYVWKDNVPSDIKMKLDYIK